MESDFGALLLIVACTFGPAALILTIFMVLQRRRSKFHRQRITKGVKTRKSEE